MDCEKYENYIALYLENDLTGAEAAELQKHIETCNSCRQQLEAMQYMQNMLKQDDQPIQPSNRIRARIYSRLYRDLLIMFAGLVIIVSMVAISGGLAQMFLFDTIAGSVKGFFFVGMLLLIVGLMILMYDIFVDIFKISLWGKKR